MNWRRKLAAIRGKEFNAWTGWDCSITCGNRDEPGCLAFEDTEKGCTQYVHKD